MILAVVGYLAAFACAWSGLGWEIWPWGMVSLAAPTAWLVGLRARKVGLLAFGLYLLAALAVGAAVEGELLPALGAMAIALWSWDLGILAVQLRRADAEARRRLMRTALPRSSAAAAAGVALGVAFAWLRLPIPFWGLAGLMVAAWVGVAALIRSARRLYAPSGGEASGNRSSSSPTR
ncbi:hypothetical protein H5T53_06630 [Candidatus Bipolaricaulota bacterium]|nr:hypothetical protein [Candidatus Bipolaricaulota bacterium]